MSQVPLVEHVGGLAARGLWGHMFSGVLLLQGKDRWQRGGRWLGRLREADVLWSGSRVSSSLETRTRGGVPVGPTGQRLSNSVCERHSGELLIHTGVWCGRATTGFSSSTRPCSCPCGRSPWTCGTAVTSTGSSRTRPTSASWRPQQVGGWAARPRLRFRLWVPRGMAGKRVPPACAGHWLL